MTTTNKRWGIKWGLCAALAALVCLSASADVIYDNSTGDITNRFNPGGLEIGDEINLAGGARYLTNFSFEFYGTNNFGAGNSVVGTITARVRFYLMGPGDFNGYLTPGTTFFDASYVFSPAEINTARSTLIFTEGFDFPTGGLFIPLDATHTNMTWSIQFSGMGGFDDIGIDIYDPPIVGSSLNDYWENNGGWKLKTNVVNMNFASKFQATPEPSSVALLVLGGMGLLYASRRSRTQ